MVDFTLIKGPGTGSNPVRPTPSGTHNDASSDVPVPSATVDFALDGSLSKEAETDQTKPCSVIGAPHNVSLEDANSLPPASQVGSINQTTQDGEEVSDTWDANVATTTFSSRFKRASIMKKGFTVEKATEILKAAAKIDKYINQAVSALSYTGMPQLQVEEVRNNLLVYRIGPEDIPDFANEAKMLIGDIHTSPELREQLTTNPSNILKYQKVVKVFQVNVDVWKPLLDTATPRVDFILIFMAITFTIKLPPHQLMKYIVEDLVLVVPKPLSFYLYYCLFHTTLRDSDILAVLGEVFYWSLVKVNEKLISIEWGPRSIWDRLENDTSLQPAPRMQYVPSPTQGCPSSSSNAATPRSSLLASPDRRVEEIDSTWEVIKAPGEVENSRSYCSESAIAFPPDPANLVPV
ncbi:hypothetical protein CXQ85_004580 [Candidozyma haemuli]|uniref:Uncharacterized protein n=1 Tax=Candidozyma haemuli TaxID=45357 RepID=A0A2V1AWM9_9ASCO|nr:hypothetical protein CXQ85_004580 [[Candida] haemuloni]PVH21916.1 hypothetical protein CXQ85_004580 [[Candida] haemuloni]